MEASHGYGRPHSVTGAEVFRLHRQPVEPEHLAGAPAPFFERQTMKSRGVFLGAKRGPYIGKQAMTFSEIGHQLGITGGAASNAFHAGMRKLKNHSSTSEKSNAEAKAMRKGRNHVSRSLRSS